MTEEQFLSHPANFINKDGIYYLVRCPICKSENYAMAVSSGICVWCGEGVDGLLVERIGDKN